MTAGRQHSETARQLVHMSMGGFALMLRWLTWWQALALAATALLFNFFVLPSIAGHLYRAGDDPRLHGILFYPLSVLMLLLCFPHRLDIVAGAWGILAIGDGIATLVGRAVGGTRWPWNRDKSVAGTSAFIVGGTVAAAFLLVWCRPARVPVESPLFIVTIALLAAIAAGAVETIPVRLDDNLSVALTAGATLWLASLIDEAQLAPAWTVLRTWLPYAVAANVAVAALGYRARTVSMSGALTGSIIGTIIFASLGWRGWLLLVLTFVAASVCSRLGLHRKMLLGIAEERGGRRGAGNAIANTGVAALCALLAVLTTSADAARLAFVAALAAAGSDTIASEIGKAWGRRTWSITSLKHVPPGTPGAMSVEGTAAGIVGALALGFGGSLLGLVPESAVVMIAIASLAGSLLESWLGATLEAPGVLNNDMLNFINSATAAFVAVLLA